MKPRLPWLWTLCLATAWHVGCQPTTAQTPPAAHQETLEPQMPQIAFTSAPAPDELAAAEDDEPLSTRKQGEDWPDFLGPRRDSKSTETGILTDWSDGKLRIVWQAGVGDSYGIGTVARGRYLQFDREDSYARLRCLNAETGKLLWQFRYPTDYSDLYGYNGGPRCSPIVDEDRVYLYGADGMLHCVTLEEGRVLWKVDTAARFGVIQNFFGVGSNPIVEGDLLLVMVGGSPPESQRIPPGQLDLVEGNGSGIVAFDKRTGEVRYQTSDELASYASLQVASAHGRRWGLAFARGGLLAFEPATGQIDFHFPWRARNLESVNASTPVVVDDQVFISETYGPGSAMLKLVSGQTEVIWQDDQRKRERVMQTHWNTPVHHEGYLYGCSGRHTANAELRCIEWKSGNEMWSVPGLTRTSLLYVDGHFVCLGEDGVLRLFRANPEKFELVTSVVLQEPPAEGSQNDQQSRPLARPRPLLRYPCWAAPILSHGLMYVRGDDRVVCVELIPQ